MGGPWVVGLRAGGSQPVRAYHADIDSNLTLTLILTLTLTLTNPPPAAPSLHPASPHPPRSTSARVTESADDTEPASDPTTHALEPASDPLPAPTPQHQEEVRVRVRV